MSWTASQDQMLRDFYAQYPPPGQVPVSDIAAVLGKVVGTVRSRAFTLGISEGSRSKSPPVKYPPIPCAECGKTYKPASKGHGVATLTCSMSCGRKRAIKEHGHNRGALGLKHTDETKAKLGAASRLMWANMDVNERQRKAEITRSVASNRQPSENTHTRAKGGRRADLNNQYFRSRWEANYARWLNFLMHQSSDITSWTFEPQCFSFPVKRGTMSYTPDFRVVFSDGHHEWHEVKGWLTQQGATALKRFAKYYPDEQLVLIDEAAYKAIAKFAKSIIGEWE